MTTSFSSLPIVDLSPLSHPSPSLEDQSRLSKELYNVFATTGFAYLTNAPLTYSHSDVFTLAKDFFTIPEDEKMMVAKQTLVKGNQNTYRGYFPLQPGKQDNLKEGFEVGPAAHSRPTEGRESRRTKLDLNEENVWPRAETFGDGRQRLEKLHNELQSLSSTLLSLLATALGKPADYFASYLDNSLSTLRLLHYPPQEPARSADGEVKLCCGLEVLNAEEQWVPAPYVPSSIVVNIGDLMAQVSGGRFVATMHRVRTNSGGAQGADGMGRFSVPFFFEPGEQCMVRSVDGGEGILYGQHIRRKMGTWVEYKDLVEERPMDESAVERGPVVEAY
ncbi:hypothetical protein KC332_g10859 [Hortaea werneckii]|uniref:Fe2OG dioxygenase domain-containing protein n=1 Tax=Hortaea werneckii EXF-2000 TaxID=1157616 RepID=A0A1Z5TMC3_HORWE|nr:hypothetical protein KC358_g10888 [Hortaea werneckii]OTA37166.1 hypothetical protein BTJ68_02944 [Hortaea werneckii EXF-2000]KAI6818647.1 hypothetical protein KC350_g10241 [Hortaea werneckii]KAI6917745.1 hypothetical protein KC348_g11104 [Hortaea werneckii]KAI6920345.1 hypothetical protein KC341_g16652 [Hortaea werneckii]